MKVYKQLIAILTLAFAFRLLLMNWRFAIGFDEPHYLQLGASAVLFGWKNLLHPYWPPMYPALIALLSVFSHNFELVGRLVSVITGTAVIIPVYILTKELFGARLGLLAAFLLALFPSVAFDSTNTLSESTYTFLSVSGVAAGWFAFKNRSVWKGALAGAFFGMSYLTKPEGLGYLFVYLFVVGVWFIFHRRRSRQLALVKIMLVTAAVTLLCASPYLLYLRHATGEWTISTKFKVNRFDLNAINRLSPDNHKSPLDMAYHLGTFHEDDVNMYAGNDGSARGMVDLAKRMAENVYKILRHAIPGVITGPMFFLMAVGLLSIRWTWSQAHLHLYLLTFIVFFWLIVIPFFHINDRYFAPLLPLCFVWIGQGTYILFKRASHFFRLMSGHKFSRSNAEWGMALTAVLLFVLSFLPELGKVVGRSSRSRDFWADAVELKDAGIWLRNNSIQQPPIIMSYNKAVDFYAGNYDLRSGVSFTNDPLSRQLAYARYRAARYLVFSERYADHFPELSPFLHSPPPDLKLLYRTTNLSVPRALLFEIILQPGDTDGR